MPSSHTDATTEEHRPPSAGEIAAGRPLLLSAFPSQVAVPIPASGEVIGRARLAELGLPDTEISGRHVRFSRSGGRHHVEDAGSRNGTWIGGVRLGTGERVALDDGAVLRLGRTLFVFREAFTGPGTPGTPIGGLVGPWGLDDVRARLRDLAARPELNVLLQGETGSGKELLARAAVEAIQRESKPFATINVAGVPAGVFESQLFGWVKGAYSGSGEGSRGLLREHEGGAVFLDEIGELPLDLQPKMLRLLENREIQPVGGKSRRVDVALVAATNRPLEEMVEQGTFRRDLLARFVARLELPALRDRPEDVFAILVELRRRRRAPLDPRAVEVEAVERLMLERWPANVRDLDRFAATADPASTLTRQAVERVLGPPAAGSAAPLTRERLAQTLADAGGNQSEARRRLGISWGTMRRRLDEWGLGRPKR
jgi:transcriptional regulator with GAF, ATPase, and Fis domain